MSAAVPAAPAPIVTERLLLRAWRPEDRAPFAKLNADPEVMAHFPQPLTRTESDALADRLQQHLTAQGWGVWALALRASGAFIGLTGLASVRADLPFAPATEIAWRLARAHWGQGLALEAARAACAHGFGVLGLPEIVAFTALPNTRSRALMQRLGMRADGQFDHPALRAGHPLRRHWLYRLDRPGGGPPGPG